MPGLDRTGPLGEGPMTGRGLGYCGQGRVFPENVVYGVGRGGRPYGGGRGRCFGGGRGWWRPSWWGRWFARSEAPVGPPESTRVDRIRALEKENAELRARLREMENRESSD